MLKNNMTLVVDDDDYEKVMQYNWFVCKSGKYLRVSTSIGGKEVTFKNLILGLYTPKRSLHKNRNPLDFRRENIVIFDSVNEYTYAIHQLGWIWTDEQRKFSRNRSGGAQGKKIGRDKASIYTGVTFLPKASKYSGRCWEASLSHNQNTYCLGAYDKQEYAAMAYDKKAIEIYGPGARVNFPNMTYEELTEKLSQVCIENMESLNRTRSMCHQGVRHRTRKKTSTFVGVSFDKKNGNKCWKAAIQHQGTGYILGHYYNEKEAALAYDEKALELFGENARVNFPIHPEVRDTDGQLPVVKNSGSVL